MDEKSRYYDLLISTVSESDYFKSLNKNIKKELLTYMNSESFKEDFDKSYDKVFGLEKTANASVFFENLISQTASSIT